MAEEKDPQDVAKAVVSNIKSGGLFDQFRRECIEALDKMEQYRQLQKRVENHVASFLSRQKWSENLSKNKLRENIRQHINQSEVIINGVQHLINEVLYDQASSFNSRIDLEVDKYLNSQRTQEQKESQKDKNIATPGKSTDGVKCADSQESSASDRSAVISKHGESSSTRFKPSSLKSCVGNEELPKNDPHGKDSVSKSRPSPHSSSSKSNPLVKRNPSSGAHSLTSDTHEVHCQSDTSPRPRTGISDSPGSTREGNKRSQSNLFGSACEKLSVTSDSAVGQATILSSISSDTKTQKQTGSRDESAKTVNREKGMVTEKICQEQLMLCSSSSGATERTHDDLIGRVGARKEARSKPNEDPCSSNQSVPPRDTESSKPSNCLTPTKKSSDLNEKCNTSTVQGDKVESDIVKEIDADQCVDRSRIGVISSTLGHSAKELNSGASKDKIELENSACDVGSGSCGEGSNVVIDQDLRTFHSRMEFVITEQETVGDDFSCERSKRKKKACPTDDDISECSDRCQKKKKCDESIEQDDPETISITVEKESGCESTSPSYPEHNEEASEANVGCSASVGSKDSDEEAHEDVDFVKNQFNVLDTSEHLCGSGARDFIEGNETDTIQEEHGKTEETEAKSGIAKLGSPPQAIEENALETENTTGSDKIGTEESKHELDIPTQVQTRGKRPRQASEDVDPSASIENDDSETYRRKKRDKPSTLFSQGEYIISPVLVKEKGSLTAGRIPRQPRETTSVLLDSSATEPRGVRTRRTSTGESDDDRANERVERGRPRTKKLKSDSNPDKVMKRGTRGSTEKVDPLSQGVAGRPKRNVKPKRCYSPSENR